MRLNTIKPACGSKPTGKRLGRGVGSGLGKTSAIRQYERTNPNVWVATMSPSTASLAPALEEVVIALGLKEVTGGAASAWPARSSRPKPSCRPAT